MFYFEKKFENYFTSLLVDAIKKDEINKRDELIKNKEKIKFEWLMSKRITTCKYEEYYALPQLE